MGGVVVVSGGERIRDVLVPVYDALEVPWLPETVGSVEEEVGGAEYEAVAEAILAEFGARYGLYDGAISDPRRCGMRRGWWGSIWRGRGRWQDSAVGSQGYVRGH